VTTSDALPRAGLWSSQTAIWAPDVIQLSADEGFVLYYSASSQADPRTHCIGAATSPTIMGPYTPLDYPLACPLSQGGAIDPAGFQDADGTLYVVYKVDGNNIGHGGNCNNAVKPIVPTPIMLQEMASNGVTPVGLPVQIFDRTDADGPLVEAPSLVSVSDKSAVGGNMYVLFFSSNCYSGPYYDTSYAISKSGIAGPYVRSAKPLLQTGAGPNGVLYAPGGLDIERDRMRVVFHANLGEKADTRQMWTGVVRIDTGGAGNVSF
jgi:beta-xylosidase